MSQGIRLILVIFAIHIPMFVVFGIMKLWIVYEMSFRGVIQAVIGQ